MTKRSIFFHTLVMGLCVYAWAVTMGIDIAMGNTSITDWALSITMFAFSVVAVFLTYKQASLRSGVVSGSGDVSISVGTAEVKKLSGLPGVKGSKFITIKLSDNTDSFLAMLDRETSEHMALSILTALQEEGDDVIAFPRRMLGVETGGKGQIRQLHELYNHQYGLGGDAKVPNKVGG